MAVPLLNPQKQRAVIFSLIIRPRSKEIRCYIEQKVQNFELFGFVDQIFCKARRLIVFYKAKQFHDADVKYNHSLDYFCILFFIFVYCQ